MVPLLHHQHVQEWNAAVLLLLNGDFDGLSEAVHVAMELVKFVRSMWPSDKAHLHPE